MWVRNQIYRAEQGQTQYQVHASLRTSIVICSAFSMHRCLYSLYAWPLSDKKMLKQLLFSILLKLAVECLPIKLGFG
jgi:hypothetical protein